MTVPVIHDQDGHADDLVATLLLAAHPAVELKAVTVNSGDCLPVVSTQVLLEILAQLGHPDVPVAYQLHDLPHPFPLAWQHESLNYLAAFPAAERHTPAQTGTQLLVRTVNESPKPVTILVTGPCTNLAAALRLAPEIALNIERVVLMAGAVNAPGNVNHPGHDGSAEWNLYADPLAAAACLEARLPVDLVTLDVTNFVPMTTAFVAALAGHSRAAEIASKLLKGVEQQNYYFWDTLAALLTCEPDFLLQTVLPVMIHTEPPSEGRLESLSSGYPVRLFQPGLATETLALRVQERLIELLSGLNRRVF